MLTKLEILEHRVSPATLEEVHVEFMGLQGDMSLEKWTVDTAMGPHAYLVSFTSSPDGGTDFLISEMEEAKPTGPTEPTHVGTDLRPKT